MTPIVLTREEVAYFFELKSKSRVEVVDEANPPDGNDGYYYEDSYGPPPRRDNNR